MKKEYDFSHSVRNPYTKQAKKQISINVSVETLDYFKKMGAQEGVPYQNLINLFLNRCASENLMLEIKH
ncbi:antitoxin [Helicobacter jaachi]|uniref:Antitoxin n=1 Tax=Helicobacter jaachi TaxID=1677920 RepID=A0A4U8TG53_9HELI|nr:BrnA antitoxin family protein [Helicobacter jaachi]TLD97687.1 antitoxin [Helicobacter jaachi]